MKVSNGLWGEFKPTVSFAKQFDVPKVFYLLMIFAIREPFFLIHYNNLTFYTADISTK